MMGIMPTALPPICILAGGRATRLGELGHDTPKALVEVAGAPFIDHQLQLLARHGARHVILCVGYLAERIVEHVGTERYGIQVNFSQDGPSPLGTLGAVRKAVPLLGPRFLVLYGDTYLRLDYGAAAAAWKLSGLPAMMTVLRNDGRWDTSNVRFEESLVTTYDKRSPDASMHWIDYGLGGFEADALDAVGPDATDLAELQAELARRRSLFGFAATERFYEIGTPEALAETGEFLRIEQ
jgi:NDP-sugar pyrophosphorylase family protein